MIVRMMPVAGFDPAGSVARVASEFRHETTSRIFAANLFEIKYFIFFSICFFSPFMVLEWYLL